MMTLEVVGDGPAVQSVTAALSATDATVTHTDEPQVTDADLVVVVDTVTTDVFSTTNERALATDTPWVAVELGGVGGVPAVDAAISGFGPETGCYRCLHDRVSANVEQDTDPTPAPTVGTQRFAGAVAGRRIEQFLEGELALLGTVTELPYTERQLLPVPGCDCGEKPSWELERAGETPPGESLARAQQGLDERIGIVTEIGEAESFPAPYYLASLTNTSGFSDATAGQQAAGVSSDWDTAFMKALGESYERYAAGVYRTDSMPTSPAEQFDDPVHPAEFVRPDSWEANEAESRAWVPAEQLSSGRQRHVPAELAVYPPPSATIRPAVTTGLGLGATTTDALLSGLYEVIERDATMLAWYSTFEPLEIAARDHDEFETLFRRARSEGLIVTTLLLTQDVDVPVVAVAVRHDEWPRLAFGSAADLDPASAAVGALEEALQNWMELRGMGPDGANEASGAIEQFASNPDAADPLLETETTVPLDSIGPDDVPAGDEELSELLERVTDASLEPLATRLTTRDVDQLGFEAVRVLCPRAQPLFFGEPFFGERAQEVPAELGFEPRLDREHHPFP